jgi:hypothetical protein
MLPGPAFFCWVIHRPDVFESFEPGTELIGEWSSTHPGHSIVSNRIPTYQPGHSLMTVMGAQIVSNVYLQMYGTIEPSTK